MDSRSNRKYIERVVLVNEGAELECMEHAAAIQSGMSMVRVDDSEALEAYRVSREQAPGQGAAGSERVPLDTEVIAAAVGRALLNGGGVIRLRVRNDRGQAERTFDAFYKKVTEEFSSSPAHKRRPQLPSL